MVPDLLNTRLLHRLQDLASFCPAICSLLRFLVRRVFLVFITGVKALLQLDQLRLKGFHGLAD